MLLKKLKIIVVFEVPNPKEKNPPQHYLKFPDWRDEKDVIVALKKLGHQVHVVGINEDIKSFILEVEQEKPDLIFNLCDTFKNKRELEANIPGVCELLNTPYTGASPLSLHLCQDKAIQKKIISYDQKIKLPSFLTVTKDRLIPNLKKLSYPVIVKPLNLEASEGISQKSYVTSPEKCLERILFLRKKFHSDVIIENYISGTDVYVGLLGNKDIGIIVGQPVKLLFHEYPSHKKKIATYKCKWDDNYRKRWGIKTTLMGESLFTKKIKKICRETYEKLKLSGYARFDLRLTSEGDCYFLEANPNPSIGKSDDFSKSASGYGLSYLEVIEKIILASFNENVL